MRKFFLSFFILFSLITFQSNIAQAQNPSEPADKNIDSINILNNGVNKKYSEINKYTELSPSDDEQELLIEEFDINLPLDFDAEMNFLGEDWFRLWIETVNQSELIFGNMTHAQELEYEMWLMGELEIESEEEGDESTAYLLTHGKLAHSATYEDEDDDVEEDTDLNLDLYDDVN